jgi:hypothetical protein
MCGKSTGKPAWYSNSDSINYFRAAFSGYVEAVFHGCSAEPGNGLPRGGNSGETGCRGYVVDHVALEAFVYILVANDVVQQQNRHIHS